MLPFQKISDLVYALQQIEIASLLSSGTLTNNFQVQCPPSTSFRCWQSLCCSADDIGTAHATQYLHLCLEALCLRNAGNVASSAPCELIEQHISKKATVL